MKVIEVFLREELFSEHPISRDRITIGRGKWNDIILSDATVSRDHASINLKKDSLEIIDNSSSGTFINGSRIKQADLSIDDKINIGPYSLFIRQYKEGAEDVDFNTTILRKTLSIPSIKGRTGKSFILNNASLNITEGTEKGAVFSIKKEKVSIGKSPDNDIVFTDEFVSRHHGEICFRNGEFFIRDIGSRNGIFVNGKRVQGAILTAGSRIEIGENRIDFNIRQDTDKGSTQKLEQPSGLIGSSHKFMSLVSLLRKAASCDATVLICGDTGTGKELAARTIHKLSSRSDGPFETIDCGAIPGNLIESELFGHEKGSFTGADSRRKGAFERGHGGTVFLDEIGELPRDLQPKLLRILEERSFKRVGGDSRIDTDIRVIAATNRELNKEVMNGNFREDLFFRLYVIPIFMPALRERLEDVPLLTDYFIKNSIALPDCTGITISGSALEKLKKYSWPGNIRELKNTIDRAIVSSNGQTISEKDIQFISSINKADKLSLPQGTSLEEVERQTIINALKAQNGNKKATARLLGIAYSTMCEKVKKYRIEI